MTEPTTEPRRRGRPTNAERAARDLADIDRAKATLAAEITAVPSPEVSARKFGEIGAPYFIDECDLRRLRFVGGDNARAWTPPDTAENTELREDIAENGIRSPLEVTPSTGQDGEEYFDWISQSMQVQTPEQEFDVDAGFRRGQQAFILGLPHAPVRVFEGEEALDRIAANLSENLHRHGLNPMEVAAGFGKLRDNGMPQKRIAEKFTRGNESLVSKHLSLLRLPADVQERLRSGRHLQAAHGHALARFADYPNVVSEMAKLAEEQGVRSRDLEAGVPFGFALGRMKVVIPLVTYGGFSECNNCELKARFDDAGSGTAWCFNVAHHNDLVEADTERRRLDREQAEQRIAEAQARGAQLTEDEANVIRDAFDTNRELGEEVARSAGPTDAEQLRNATKTIGEAIEASGGVTDDIREHMVMLPYTSIPLLTSLAMGSYCQIPTHAPEGCTGQCPCRSEARLSNGATVSICQNPRRFNDLQVAAEKAERKRQKEHTEAMASQVVDKVKSTASLEQQIRHVALMAATCFPEISDGQATSVYRRHGIEIPREALNLHGIQRQRALVEFFAGYSDVLIAACAAETRLLTELQQSTAGSHPLTDWYLRIPEGFGGDKAPEPSQQKITRFEWLDPESHECRFISILGPTGRNDTWFTSNLQTKTTIETKATDGLAVIRSVIHNECKGVAIPDEVHAFTEDGELVVLAEA